MPTKTAAIIQARMGSTRLPGKTLALIGEKTLLQHLVDRVSSSSLIDQVIIATTTETRDDVLVEHAKELGLEYFRGSEDDVLDRVYQTAQHYQVENIVRVTPDCPFIDVAVMNQVIQAYVTGQYDYVSNTMRRTYPDGLDVEVFSLDALRRAWQEADTPSDREHVTPYIRNCGHFRLFSVEGKTDLSHYKWSVDSVDDLAFARSLHEKLQPTGANTHLEDILSLLRANPDLMSINQESVVNEGYYKSLVLDPPVLARELPVTESYALKERAQALIPSGTQTFSKGHTQYVQGVAPVFLSRGQGSHVWDVDGNEYIDYPMALGPVILGHNYPSVTEAVTRQLKDGVSFSLSHPLEVELAQLLIDIIPSAQMVRFGKNGSDATSGSVRVARAYTGRDMVACCGYHGWQDWYIGTTTRNLGVPKAVQDLTTTFQYNDLGSLERVFEQFPSQVAAVIMEPVGIVEPYAGYLQQVKELTHREGAVLIFDEVITGFRLDLQGAQGYYGVEPDMTCLGKAMANGFPLSAVVGRREVMEFFDEVFFSFTFGGETLSLAASLATIQTMQKENVIGHLWNQGRKLKDGYNVLSREFGIDEQTSCVGLPPRTVLTFKDAFGEDSLAIKGLFQQECVKRGVLTAGYHNICYSHSDQDIEYTLKVYRTVLEILSQAIREGDVEQRLEGKPLQAVFRQA